MAQFNFRFQLEFDEDRKVVAARLIPTLDSTTVNYDVLLRELVNHGYAEYFRFDEKIDELFTLSADLAGKGQKIYSELVNRIKSSLQSTDAVGTHGGAAEVVEDAVDEEDHLSTISAESVYALIESPDIVIDIAEKRDAVIEITASEDGMQAFLNVTPAFGGKPAADQAIRQLLKAFGIRVTLDQEIVTQTVANGQCDHQLVAKGVPPRKGKDSPFKPLVQNQINSGPVIDELGNANYLDINEFVVVEAGQKLMRREAPSPGKGGKDVFGRAIPPLPGDWLPFYTDIEGAEVSANDSNLLIASGKGHPVIHERGVSVDPVLRLENVSLTTGNIDFDGSLHVAQDVADGMSIKVTGDVVVQGVVGKSTINAGNNVVIMQGLIGGVANEDDQHTKNYGAEVMAKGAVSVRFATMAKIDAKTDINITEYAIHCDLKASKRILIGERTGKGNLIGGYAEAFDLVFAKTLGSKGSAVTQIRVGARANTIDKLRHTIQSLRKKNDEATEIRKQIARLEERFKLGDMPPQTAARIDRLSRHLDTLATEIADRKKKEEYFKSQLLRSKKSRVIGKNRVHQNVLVDILGSGYRTKEDLAGGTFSFSVRRVVFAR